MRRNTGEIPSEQNEVREAHRPPGEPEGSPTELRAGKVLYFPKPDPETNRLIAAAHALDAQMKTVSEQMDQTRFWQVGERRQLTNEREKVNQERSRTYQELYERTRERVGGAPTAAELEAAFRRVVTKLMPNLNLPEVPLAEPAAVGRAIMLPQTDLIRTSLRTIRENDPVLAPFAEQGLRLQQALLNELKSRGSGAQALLPEDFSDRALLLRDGTERLVWLLQTLEVGSIPDELRAFADGKMSFSRVFPDDVIRDLVMLSASKNPEKNAAAKQALKIIGVLKDVSKSSNRGADLSKVKFSDEPREEGLAAK